MHTENQSACQQAMSEAEKFNVVECCHVQVGAMLESLPLYMRSDYLAVMSALCIRMLEQTHGLEYITGFLSEALSQMKASAEASCKVKH